MDFKGPLPSNTKNHCIFTVVDEFLRFPFAFACKDTSSRTVISCLRSLFSLFGFPAIVHTDTAKCFISKEIKEFLNERKIASTFSSVYNPRGNSQCERFNGVIWNTVKLALRTNGLEIADWEMVIPEVFYSLHSLLCTATNEVPHDRFLKFPRRSMFSTNTPIWMTEPGPVYVRKHVRDKYDPVVEKMDLLHAKQNYAVALSPEGREVTVSARDIAPTPASPGETNESQSLSQSNEISFSTLERTNSGSHDLPRRNDSDNQPDLQTTLNWRSSSQDDPR